MILSRLNAGDKKIQLSIKTDVKDICKIKNNATLISIFFNRIFSHINILNINGFIIIFEEIKAFLYFSVLIFNQENIDRLRPTSTLRSL